MLEKYKERTANSPDSYLEALIPLILRIVDIMLIFYIGKRFDGDVFSTKVTSHLVLRQAVNSGSEFDGECLGVRVIKVIAYVQPLNVSPEPKNWYTTLKAMIEIDKIA